MEVQRYPMSVRLIGVMKKEKVKVYMVSVLWSDHNDIVVYRSFEDFKKMHKKLKKTFPSSGSLNNSHRILPKFKAIKIKKKVQKTGPTKSLKSLEFLQKYCNKLLQCDQHVTQSSHLIQFFQPKDQDLQPDFAKNSIMIMPSDDAIKSEEPQGNGGNVTQPFVTETYRCVAPYETKDTKNKPFKVTLDEKVDVLIKDKAGWWLVENESKRMAWFPAPYLEKVDDYDDDEPDGTSERGKLYTVVKNYKATKDDEISVTIGSLVEVLEMSDNGWWLIRYNGKAGYIPTMYLQPYSHPHLRMAPIRDRLSPTQFHVPVSNLSNQLSRSQGNLLEPQPVSPSSPNQLQPQKRSRSLEMLSELPPTKPAAKTALTPKNRPTPSTENLAQPLPTIKVEMDEGTVENSMTIDSEGSFGSFDSDSTDFSLSDDLSSSSASSVLNLSYDAAYKRLQVSRTPPPPTTTSLLSPSSAEVKLTPSVSDPNLYKGPKAPKVPPRPQTQEILTRCTTITRKNASRGGSPVPPEITSC
ncbi:NADPH oxidase organizer 1a [Thalassophryne amazonica]|uniref:NADPH oxidase organizer 1a n=1 Tax=Thalassophryne amazonica TaxID=390379 RepID=UPI001471BA27|nr:NADPH oxidase organizer 1a [Thalassophryne amazonica]